jgi:hypothetical protein
LGKTVSIADIQWLSLSVSLFCVVFSRMVIGGISFKDIISGSCKVLVERKVSLFGAGGSMACQSLR